MDPLELEAVAHFEISGFVDDLGSGQSCEDGGERDQLGNALHFCSVTKSGGVNYQCEMRNGKER